MWTAPSSPKLAPHFGAMRVSIEDILGIVPECESVKAKTVEKMGPVGEG